MLVMSSQAAKGLLSIALDKQFQFFSILSPSFGSVCVCVCVLCVCVQKKSREESEGHDSAVEILENRPYTDGPQGRGQYTYKIFHIGLVPASRKHTLSLSLTFIREAPAQLVPQHSSQVSSGGARGVMECLPLH